MLDPRLDRVALRAPLRIGPGAYRWFDYALAQDGSVTIDAAEEATSFAGLVASMEELRSRPGPLAVLGYSQGGMMALSLLRARPDLLDACAVVNGRMLEETAYRSAAAEAIRGPSVRTAVNVKSVSKSVPTR